MTALENFRKYEKRQQSLARLCWVAGVVTAVPLVYMMCSSRAMAGEVQRCVLIGVASAGSLAMAIGFTLISTVACPFCNLRIQPSRYPLNGKRCPLCGQTLMVKEAESQTPDSPLSVHKK